MLNMRGEAGLTIVAEGGGGTLCRSRVVGDGDAWLLAEDALCLSVGGGLRRRSWGRGEGDAMASGGGDVKGEAGLTLLLLKEEKARCAGLREEEARCAGPEW